MTIHGPEKTTDIDDAIKAIMVDMDAAPDTKLGGPAAQAARENARLVADYLIGLGEEPLPRHAGKPSAGKVAQAISTTKRRFNRQNFGTNVWCARLLAAYDQWEMREGPTQLEKAQDAAEAKEPTNRRMAELEQQMLLLRSENDRLRQELTHLRGFVAETGRLP